MSRLTGADALGLYEAYQAVYNPQELTEEQVWEEVEIWVNSLLEEGYDLSDYTWEEMYEAYVEEARAEGVKPYKP
jgi:thioester reductase-like protein